MARSLVTNEKPESTSDSPILSTDGEQLLAGEIDPDEYLRRRREAAEVTARHEVEISTAITEKRFLRLAAFYLGSLVALGYLGVAIFAFTRDNFKITTVALGTAGVLLGGAVSVGLHTRSNRR